MAIFGTKKKSATVSEVKDARGKLSTMLLAPWLSEKALIATERGVYAFHVPKEATKHDVMLAVQRAYEVKPRMVRMVNLPAKRVSLRTRRGFGTKSGRRKAYVYLKKGDTIQFA